MWGGDYVKVTQCFSTPFFAISVMYYQHLYNLYVIKNKNPVINIKLYIIPLVLKLSSCFQIWHMELHGFCINVVEFYSMFIPSSSGENSFAADLTFPYYIPSNHYQHDVNDLSFVFHTFEHRYKNGKDQISIDPGGYEHHLNVCLDRSPDSGQRP